MILNDNLNRFKHFFGQYYLSQCSLKKKTVQILLILLISFYNFHFIKEVVVYSTSRNIQLPDWKFWHINGHKTRIFWSHRYGDMLESDVLYIQRIFPFNKVKVRGKKSL